MLNLETRNFFQCDLDIEISSKFPLMNLTFTIWQNKVEVYPILKDKVLLTVGCTIFPPMYLFIAKYLFTGSLKDRSIDI
jgi:hypothetical protein